MDSKQYHLVSFELGPLDTTLVFSTYFTCQDNLQLLLDRVKAYRQLTTLLIQCLGLTSMVLMVSWLMKQPWAKVRSCRQVPAFCRSGAETQTLNVGNPNPFVHVFVFYYPSLLWGANDVPFPFYS
jgi:hypothetical protein